MSSNIHNTTINFINLMHFYFFKSTNEKDSISGISVFTTTRKKAFALAYNYFAKHNCKGEPAIIAI